MRDSEFVNGVPIIGISYHDIPPRNENIPLKCYHTLRITYVRQGSGIWSIGNKQYPIEPGDVFLFNNREFRAVRTIFPPDRLRLTVIDFEPRLIWSSHQELIHSNELKLFFNRSSGFDNRIPGDTAVSSLIVPIIEEMERELAAKLPEYKQMLKVKLMNMLVLLNRHYSESVSKSYESSVSLQQFPLITHIMMYIDEHLEEELSRGQLAEHFHIHPVTLSKLFKRWNGIGLRQYIIRKKIYASIQLLEQTDMSVLEIANRCGFNATANFYKAFRSVTGGVPSDYRPFNQ